MTTPSPDSFPEFDPRFDPEPMNVMALKVEDWQMGIGFGAPVGSDAAPVSIVSISFAGVAMNQAVDPILVAMTVDEAEEFLRDLTEAVHRARHA